MRLVWGGGPWISVARRTYCSFGTCGPCRTVCLTPISCLCRTSGPRKSTRKPMSHPLFRAGSEADAESSRYVLRTRQHSRSVVLVDRLERSVTEGQDSILGARAEDSSSEPAPSWGARGLPGVSVFGGAERYTPKRGFVFTFRVLFREPSLGLDGSTGTLKVMTNPPSAPIPIPLRTKCS